MKTISYLFICLLPSSFHCMEQDQFTAPTNIEKKLIEIKETILEQEAQISMSNEKIRFYKAKSLDHQACCVNRNPYYITYFSCPTEDEAEKQIEALHVENKPVTFLVMPSTAPQNLGALLVKKGFKVKNLAALYYSLDNNIVMKSMPETFITKMDSRTPEWLEMYEPGSSLTPKNAKPLCKNIEDYGLFYQGKLVTIASLFVKDNWVSLLNGNTREEYQKRGFATLLGAFLLKTAKDRGYKHVIMPAVPLSAEIALRKFNAKIVFDFQLYHNQ